MKLKLGPRLADICLGTTDITGFISIYFNFDKRECVNKENLKIEIIFQVSFRIVEG